MSLRYLAESAKRAVELTLGRGVGNDTVRSEVHGVVQGPMKIFIGEATGGLGAAL